MNCPKCGFESDGKFCPNCGTPLSSSPEFLQDEDGGASHPSLPEFLQDENDSIPPKISNKNWWDGVIISVVVLAILSVIIIVSIAIHRRENESSSLSSSITSSLSSGSDILNFDNDTSVETYHLHNFSIDIPSDWILIKDDLPKSIGFSPELSDNPTILSIMCFDNPNHLTAKEFLDAMSSQFESTMDDFDLINICTNNTYHDTPYAQLEFNYNNNGITTREITTGFASGENIMIVVFSQPLSSLGDYLIESLDIITSVVISDFNADSEVHTSTSSHDGELSSRSNAEISNQEIQSAPTTGQKNALSTALQYLSVLSFSRSGLIDQLEYEGFTNEEAVYAVDNCGADWNEQASKCAKYYLELMPFSRQELVDQLLYEGFTQSQAEYGVSQNGY